MHGPRMRELLPKKKAFRARILPMSLFGGRSKSAAKTASQDGAVKIHRNSGFVFVLDATQAAAALNNSH
jgi:hypothetical protein